MLGTGDSVLAVEAPGRRMIPGVRRLNRTRARRRSVLLSEPVLTLVLPTFLESFDAYCILRLGLGRHARREGRSVGRSSKHLAFSVDIEPVKRLSVEE